MFAERLSNRDTLRGSRATQNYADKTESILVSFDQAEDSLSVHLRYIVRDSTYNQLARINASFINVSYFTFLKALDI